MASKPKAGGAKGRPAKAATKTREKSQRERFIEAARIAGVDETGAEFELAVTRLLPPKRATRSRKLPQR
jgi:hypothetical protein